MNIDIKLSNKIPAEYDNVGAIYELDKRLEALSPQGDEIDYIVSAASGLLCGMLDILWVGEFNLSEGRALASEKVDAFVNKTAKMLGCNKEDLQSSVKYLEERFPIPSDGNTPNFGGGLQHHLRDFAHHPTVVGLIFSLLTQFTEMSYGTDSVGKFIIVPVPEKSKIFIGKSIPEKIFKGTIVWFFHLVSDMAGSSAAAEFSGGTGIPGPLLSLAKEISALPFFKNIKIGNDKLTHFLSRLFNGTFFASRDAEGKIIRDTVLRFDLRGELGALLEIGKQAIPVVANECIVRTFYAIRRFGMQIKRHSISTFDDPKKLDWNKVLPTTKDNPTLMRMLTIATGVFTTVDVTEAVITQKYFLSINYVGVGRFVVAVGTETANFLKKRKLEQLKEMYETIGLNVFDMTNNRLYERIGNMDKEFEKLGLSLEQTEILYNLEYYKALNDTVKTRNAEHAKLKRQWLCEWKNYISNGFAKFVEKPDAVMHWYSEDKFYQEVEKNDPHQPWFRLVLLEAMLFEPYFPLSMIEKKGNMVPDKTYNFLRYHKSEGDKFLENFFTEDFYKQGYIKRLRNCHDKVMMELTEVMKTALITLAVTSGAAIITVITAGAFAPAIAVALVGSSFPGLHGAALASACLAYLGGGAIAAGGMGMAGGTAVIVGGGAILGVAGGAGIGGAVGGISLMNKKTTILQSAKLLVSVREIFLNDEMDVDFSNTVYEQYVKNVSNIEKELVDLRMTADSASDDDKKKIKAQIKSAEKSVKAMKHVMKSMRKYISSFKTGLENS